MRTDRLLLTSGAVVASLLVSLIGAGLGCGTSSSKSRVTLRPEVGEVPADMRGDFEVFLENCSKCHDVERAFAAPVTDNRHWTLYVGKMMRTAGSGISAKEAPHILRFLYWYTGRKTGRIAADGVDANQPEPAPEAVESVPSHKEEPSTSAPVAPQPEAVTTEIEGESQQ